MGLDCYFCTVNKNTGEFDDYLPSHIIDKFKTSKAFKELCSIATKEHASLKGRRYAPFIQRFTGLSVYKDWSPDMIESALLDIQTYNRCSLEKQTLLLEDYVEYNFAEEHTIPELLQLFGAFEDLFQICAEYHLGMNADF